MAFSRQHYIRIADIIRRVDFDESVKEYLVREFVEMFKSDNSRFSEIRFRDYINKE